MVAENCMHHEAIRRDVEHLAQEYDDHEHRIRTLEQAHWRASAVSGLISGIIAAAAVVLAALLKAG
jgi:hypothetical protein